MKIKNKMNYQDKTKDELLKELQELQLDYYSLKTSCEKDIIERKQVAEDLQKSEERFRALIEFSLDVTTILDAQGTVLYQSPNYANVWGRDPSGEVGKDMFKDIHPDDVPLVGDTFNRLLKNLKEPVQLEVRALHTDGTWHTLEITAYNYLENPALRGIVVNFHDITERKQAEEALRLEKENFRYSLDDSPLGVRIATMEGDTIYANKALLDFYGYTSLRELQKTPLKDRYTPESYLQAQKRKSQRKRGDLRATDYEISIVRKNGEIRHLQVFRKEVLWDGVSQFQVICNDITERKQAEKEVRKSKKLLEDLHVHLNEILENERALISREIHDQIGQSLTALKLDLNWMDKYINTNPEAVTKHRGMIELVSNTIKDVQRISSDLRPGILDDLGLTAAIEWYSGEFEKRTGIRCNLKLGDSIFGDCQKNLVFFRVLQEALTNVIRHANASSVTIELRHTQKGMRLAIQDNGIGITSEEVESTKSLGLIGMHERIKKFGGKVDISLKKGQGTKLTIFIPEKKKSVP
jgi:PAS domain S-box-containing protein